MALKSNTKPAAKTPTPAPAPMNPVEAAQAAAPAQVAPPESAPQAEPQAPAAGEPAVSQVGKKRVSDAAFIRAFNASASYEEVMAKTGLKEDTIRNRARDLASQGIPLRAFVVQRAARTGVDPEELKRLALETLPEGAAIYTVRRRKTEAAEAAPSA